MSFMLPYARFSQLVVVLSCSSASPLVMAINASHSDNNVASNFDNNFTSNNFANSIDQYYVSKPEIQSSYADITSKEYHCSGQWIIPEVSRLKRINAHPTHSSKNTNSDVDVTVNTEKNTIADSTYDIKTDTQRDNTNLIYAEADSVYVSAEQQVTLSGDVIIENADNAFTGQTVTIDLKNKKASAKEQIQLVQNGIFSQSDALNVDLDNNKTELSDSDFFSASTHAHGHADTIKQLSKDKLKFTNVSYSTCPPVSTDSYKHPSKKASKSKKAKTKPAWVIEAKQLTLSDKTGRAELTNPTLYVSGVPIFYFPYLNFPIDNRRMSGWLTPQPGFTSNGGIELSLPYYLNLATNYDVTVSPKVFSKRGIALDSQFRMLTHYGTSQIDFGYIPHDNVNKLNNRRKVTAEHNWQISPTLSLHGFYNYISDKDYYADFSADPNAGNELNIPRGLVISYSKVNPNLSNQQLSTDKTIYAKHSNLDAKLRIETYQTVTNDVPDVDKPYSRLPQLTVNYDKQLTENLITSTQSDFGYFVKPIKDQSHIEDSGVRLFNRVNLGYTAAKSWGSLEPKMAIKHISTWFNQDSAEQKQLIDDEDKFISVLQPELSVLGKLHIEKNTDMSKNGYQHLITPSFYYVYSPYVNQSQLPNYDTVTASQSYDQLFNNDRFIGNARLADANALTVGINYQLFDDSNLERFNIGIANRLNFFNTQTSLNGTKQEIPDSSGVIMRVQGYLTPKLQLMSDFALTGKGKQNFNISKLSWRPHHHTLVNLSYMDRYADSDQEQRSFQQLVSSVMVPINTRWQLFGHVQYDYNNDAYRDVLLGANYESCCYRFALYGRSFYNNLDEISSEKPNRQVMAEVSFKGLTGNTSQLSKLLEKKIMGFNDTSTNWKK